MRYLLLLLVTFSLNAQELVTFKHIDYERTEADGCEGWGCGKFSAIIMEPKVVSIPNLSARELYERTKYWVDENFKRGEEIILGDNEDEYLRFEGVSSGLVFNYNWLSGSGTSPVRWQVEIRFRDGRFRWKYLTFNDQAPEVSGLFSRYKLLNKRGKPVNPEHIFNLQRTELGLATPINNLAAYLRTDDGSADDW